MKRNQRGQSNQHSSQNRNENFSPTSQQQFSFPLYNGAAPSVPPRHLNNGIPSRESTFKRLEQQQLKMAQQQDSGIQPSQYYQTGHHNVQGSPVSSRLPSMLHRQHSGDSNPIKQQAIPQHQKQVYKQPRAYNSGETRILNEQSQSFDRGDEVGPLSLVEGPMRMFIDTNTAQVEDSPQRFLQQFSRSVVSSNASNSDTETSTPSRIPHLGPISSAIFGNTRDNRNVHEILDPGEKTLEDKLLNMNETQRIEYLRTNHPELLNEYRNRTLTMQQLASQNIRISTTSNNSTFHDPSEKLVSPTQQRDAYSSRPDSRETIVRLSNGKPLPQTYNPASIADDLSSRPVVDPSIRFQQQTPPNSIGRKSSTNQPLFPQTHNQQYSDKPPGYRDYFKGNTPINSSGLKNFSDAARNTDDESYFDRKKSESQQQREVPSVTQPKKSGGLKWISLNENGSDEPSTSISSSISSRRNSESSSEIRITQSSHTPDKIQIMTQATMSPTNKNLIGQPVLTNSREKAIGTSSQGIPVPLASKFNPTQETRKTSFSGILYFFFLTLNVLYRKKIFS